MNGIEKDLEDSVRVIRLDVSSDLGKDGAGRFGVTSVPTTLVLDGEGSVVHRETGIPDRKEVVAQARSARQSLRG